MIVGKEEAARDAIEREVFAEKHVVHPGRRIDLDLDAIAGGSAKVEYAVYEKTRRLAKLIWHDFLEVLRVDPDDRFRQAQSAFDFLQANFMMREIVNDGAAADAFVAHDMQIGHGERSVLEANPGARFIHRGAAKTGPLSADVPIANPGFRVAPVAMNGEANQWRARPLPFCQEMCQLR